MNYSEIKLGIEYHQMEAINSLFEYVRLNKPDMIIKIKRDYLIKRINQIKNGDKTLDDIQDEIASAIAGDVPDLSGIILGWDSTPPDSIEAIGSVIDENGVPILGAVVEYNDEILFTNTLGQFVLEVDANLYKSEIFFKVSTLGKDSKFASFIAVSKNVSIDPVILFSSILAGTLSDAGGTIELNSRGGHSEKVSLEFPPAAIVDANGMPHTGAFSIYGSYVNPTELLYEDYTEAPLSGGNSIIAPEGVINVNLFDSEGNKLQIKEGEVVTVKLPVVTSNPPSEIPLVYFDEVNKTWVTDGVAILDSLNNQYVGEISHFTCWKAWEQLESVKCFCKFGCGIKSIPVPVFIQCRVTYPSGEIKTFYSRFTNSRVQVLPINYDVEFIWQDKVMLKYNTGPYPRSGEVIKIKMPCEKLTARIRLYHNNTPLDVINDLGGTPKLYGLLDDKFTPETDEPGLFTKDVVLPAGYELISRQQYWESITDEDPLICTNAPNTYLFDAAISSIVDGELLYGAVDPSKIIIDRDTDPDEMILDLGSIYIKSQTEEQANVGSITLYDDDTNEIIVKELVLIEDNEEDEIQSGNDTPTYLIFNSRKVVTVINKFDYSWIEPVEDYYGNIRTVTPRSPDEWGTDLLLEIRDIDKAWNYDIHEQRKHLDPTYDYYNGEGETEYNVTIEITRPLSEVHNIVFHSVIGGRYTFASRYEPFHVTCKKPTQGMWYDYQEYGGLFIHQNIDVRYKLGTKNLRLEIRV